MTMAVVSLMVKKLPVVKREKTAEKQMGCRRLDQERVLFSWDRSNCHGYRYAVQKALKGKLPMRVAREQVLLPSVRQLWEVALMRRCKRRQGRPHKRRWSQGGRDAPSPRSRKLIAI